MIILGGSMEVLSVLDKVCENNTTKNYKNKKEQLIEALTIYIMYDDNSLFSSKNARILLNEYNSKQCKTEIIKNIILVYHYKKANNLNQIKYINKLPKDFNEEELEYTINNLFTLGGIKAVDIYLNTFKEIPYKCVEHFIKYRYQANRINKNSIARYLKEKEQLQIDFRRIDEYYGNEKETLK